MALTVYVGRYNSTVPEVDKQKRNGLMFYFSKSTHSTHYRLGDEMIPEDATIFII